MLQHGLSSGVKLSTDRTVGPGRVMLLLEVSVQRLDEGKLLITEVTAPWLVVRMFSVHVVHQPSESPALLATQLADTEPFPMLRKSNLSRVTYFSLFDLLCGFCPWPSPPPPLSVDDGHLRLGAVGTSPPPLYHHLSMGQTVVTRTGPGH